MNLLLTLIWMALTGKFILVNFIFGYILSFFILWMMARTPGEKRYFYRLPRIISFILYFLKELVNSNIQVAYNVIRPKFMKPGIVKVPIDAKTDLEITLLSSIITLTPGSLVVDVSDDKKVLYIHAMYVKDRESFIHGIKTGFEKRLLEILR